MQQGENRWQGLACGNFDLRALIAEVADAAIDRDDMARAIADPAAQQGALARLGASFLADGRLVSHTVKVKAQSLRRRKDRAGQVSSSDVTGGSR